MIGSKKERKQEVAEMNQYGKSDCGKRKGGKVRRGNREIEGGGECPQIREMNSNANQ